MTTRDRRCNFKDKQRKLKPWRFFEKKYETRTPSKPMTTP